MGDSTRHTFDARRRQWIAKDVLFYSGDLGVDIRERFGPIGWVVFDAFLAACKRNSTQGQMSYTSPAGALVVMDIPDLALINEAGEPWTLDEFWGFLGRRHQVRKQRRGRTVTVVSTTWDKWQRAPGRAVGDGNSSSANRRTTVASTNTTGTRPEHDTQTSRSEHEIADELQQDVTHDSNPDPNPDRDNDKDPDPSALSTADGWAANMAAQTDEGSNAHRSGGVRVGSGYTDAQLRGAIDVLASICTGDNKQFVRQEAVHVIGLCYSRVPVDIVQDAIVALGGNPPTLPRALLTVVKAECRRRGVPTPALDLNFVKRAV